MLTEIKGALAETRFALVEMGWFSEKKIESSLTVL
jgi:hypothetical protein